MADIQERPRAGSPPPEHPDWEIVWVQNLREHFKSGTFSRAHFPEWNDIFLTETNKLLEAASEAADTIDAKDAQLALQAVEIERLTKERGAALAGLEQEGRNHWAQRDRAEAAQAEIARYREALEPFASVAKAMDSQGIGWGDDYFPINRPPLRDFRRARNALEKGA